MSVPLSAAALALLLSAATPAHAQDAAPAHRITVTGQGQTTIAPDLAVLQIGVDLVRPTSQVALNDASTRAQNLIRALRRAGIEERDLQTRTLQIHPNYEHRNGRSHLTGYRASNVLSVKIRDLSRTGEVIDAAVQAAGDEATLQGVRFEREDDASALREARQAAWRDATDKAQQLATLAEIPLGPALNITEGTSGHSPPVARQQIMQMSASTPVEAGELSISVHLTVDFQLGTDPR